MTGSCRAIMAALRSVRETYTSFMVFIAFSLPGSGGCRLRRGVDAFGVVHLQPGQGRIEHANDPQRLGSAAQPVLIVFNQRINHNAAQRIFLPVGYAFNLAVAFYAPHHIKMVPVVDMGFRTRENDGSFTY